MKKPRQIALIKKEKIEIQFGGDKLLAQEKRSSAIGKRKVHRPLATNRPMHIILKSSRARGHHAISPSRHDLKQLTQKMGRKFSVQVLGVALNWNHVHMVVKISTRLNYVRFIRALTGAMVLKLKKSSAPNTLDSEKMALSNKTNEPRVRFFDQTTFTKVGTWGAQLKNWLQYLEKNEMQAQGLR